MVKDKQRKNDKRPGLARFRWGFLTEHSNPRDERTIILQIFVNISLFFTLLTVPFVEILRRELASQHIDINLGKRN